jgi:hypothetical protein
MPLEIDVWWLGKDFSWEALEGRNEATIHAMKMFCPPECRMGSTRFNAFHEKSDDNPNINPVLSKRAVFVRVCL